MEAALSVCDFEHIGSIGATVVSLNRNNSSELSERCNGAAASTSERLTGSTTVKTTACEAIGAMLAASEQRQMSVLWLDFRAEGIGRQESRKESDNRPREISCVSPIEKNAQK